MVFLFIGTVIMSGLFIFLKLKILLITKNNFIFSDHHFWFPTATDGLDMIGSELQEIIVDQAINDSNQ